MSTRCRRAAHVGDAGRAGIEGERRRGDRLARADPGGGTGRVQGGGAVGDGHREPGAGDLAQRGLETLDCGPGGEEVAAEHLDDGGDVVVVDRLAPVRDHAKPLQQLRFGQPPVVGVAGVAEVVGQRRAVHPPRRVGPPRVFGQHHVLVADVDRVAGFVAGEQDLVELLARPDADDLGRDPRGQGVGQVDDAHAGDLRDEDLAALGVLEREQDQVHGLGERDPEPGHPLVGDGEPSVSASCWRNTGTTEPREPTTLP